MFKSAFLPRRIRAACACFTLLTLLGGLPAPVTAAQTGEAELKAAFLFNFLKLTEWPESSSTETIDLCLARVDSFDKALEIFQGQQIQGKPIQTRVLESAKNIAGCRLLFIPDSDKVSAIPAWLEAAGNAAVLTVSDRSGFIEHGGMIGLIILDNKLRFEVNLEPVQRSGLKLRAQLLQLALRVEGVKP